MRVWYPAPCSLNQASTSSSTRNAICALRDGSGNPRCATALAQSAGEVRGASCVNLMSRSDIAASFAQFVLPLAPPAVVTRPVLFFMSFCLSGRNEMRNVAFFAARGPHHEEGNAIDNSNTLVAALAIGVPHVFPRQQVATKEIPQVCEVDAVILQIAAPLRFIPGVHGNDCRCKCIYNTRASAAFQVSGMPRQVRLSCAAA